MDKLQREVKEVLRNSGAGYLNHLDIEKQINKPRIAAGQKEVPLKAIKGAVAKLEAAGKLARPEAFCLAEHA